MEFLVLKITLFINLSVLLIIIFGLTPTISITPPNYNVTKPNCVDRCGNISIPFPFGTTPNCYHSYGFFVTCNHTFNPRPKLFMQDGEIEITDISPHGQLKVLQYIARDCYKRNGSRIPHLETGIELPISMTVNNTANKLTVVGCNTYGFVYGRRLDRSYRIGCTAMCDSMQDLVEGSCMGLGCCQNVIPRDVWRVDIAVRIYDSDISVWDFNDCSYAFLAEESAFTFSPESLTNLRNVEKLPMVADWAIGNGTCQEAQMNSSSYACGGAYSRCYKPDTGYGYRCRCKDGYEGNPYLADGCQLGVTISTPPPPPNYPVSKPNCNYRCGNINIPYPFGTTENCYHSDGFLVSCNHTFNPAKLFIQHGDMEITDISLDGQLKVLQFIAHDCYDRNGRRTYTSYPNIYLPISMTVNNTANKFTIVGCDTYGYVYGQRLDRNYTTGCTAMCNSMQDLVEGSCMGLGCYQNVIPRDVWRVEIEVSSFDNHSSVWDFNDCSYAFLAEESAFSFSAESLTNLKNVEKLPMVADWAIGNGTCEEAKMNSSSYACVSTNSRCYKPDNGYGYRCRCEDGYEGNPYLIDGCRDIDECKVPELNTCKHDDCENTQGGFKCRCPKGYHGCNRVESLTLKLVAGISLGVIGLLLALCCFYLDFKRRRLNSAKQKFFLQNGGALLQEELMRRERSPDMVKIFSSSELEKATNDFHSSMIIGQGGFGTVYKGLLPNNNIIAIKKSKRVDPKQIDQFINEVIVLSQINHRNVVRLLGCCLETEVPLLVYEFIDNGTLAANIHNQAKARFINWSMRLKIAVETAGVLSYLHSAASTPIIHRDVKSDNILLDHNFTAKVSDFGASRFVPLDKTQLSTMVQGTFGYLDPEYMQTNQLTEKSDVYSFGVVLVELLTGRKALSFDRPEDEHNLANFFLSVLKKKQLLHVLDDNIVGEGNMEQVTEVAKLAQGCLHVKGEDRPSMKEVAMELEGLRLGGKHSWAQNEHNEEETESLIGVGLNGFTYGDENSSSIAYDSFRDHATLPITGGR